LQVPGLTDRDALARAAAQLRSVASGEAQLVLTFDRPLTPAWTIVDPLGLRRNPAGGALQVEVAASAELASFPVEVVSDYLDLELDVTIESMEWSSTLQVELVPEGAATAVLGVQATATGGGRSTSRIYHCGFGPHRVAARPSTTARSARRTTRTRCGSPAPSRARGRSGRVAIAWSCAARRPTARRSCGRRSIASR
jgi:hypothetical protein